MSGFGIFPDHAPQYGASDTYLAAAAWLDGHGTVYDWGAGKGFSRNFFSQSPWIGLDGTFAGEDNLDLANLRMHCDSILMRHVLEHNPDCWQRILQNAVHSFRKRMVLVTFTPFSEQTEIFKTERYASGVLAYLSFCKTDLTSIMGEYLVRDAAMPTTHPEHVFFLCK